VAYLESSCTSNELELHCVRQLASTLPGNLHRAYGLTAAHSVLCSYNKPSSTPRHISSSDRPTRSLLTASSSMPLHASRMTGVDLLDSSSSHHSSSPLEDIDVDQVYS